MAKGDIQPYQNAGANKTDGSIKAVVASGTTASINAGEPVVKTVAGVAAKLAATADPNTTNRIVGVAASASTETASVSGLVDVIPVNPGQIWMIAPKVAASWNTQATYNARIGKRYSLDLTGGVFTIDTTDGATNGMIVEYIDVARYPGMVAFSWSPSWDYRLAA